MNLFKSLVKVSFINIFFLNIIFLCAFVGSLQAAVNPLSGDQLSKDLEKKEINIEDHKLKADEIKKIKAQAQKTKKDWKLRTIKSTSLATTKRFMRAQQHMSAKNYKNAVRLLDKVIERSSSSDYEKAKALSHKVTALMSSKKYAEAEMAARKSLEIGKLSYRESVDALLSLAQVQLITKNFKMAKTNLIRFIEISDSESGAARMMLASVNYELKEDKEALENIELALGSTKEPAETWLYFASAIYVRSKMFDKAEKVLKDLVQKRQNNKSYWMSLIAVLIENDKNNEALKNLELAQKLGFIKASSEIQNRSTLLMTEGIPYKAATVLSEALKAEKIKETAANYETLATFWFLAKDFDRSIEAYKKASALSDDGRIHLLLGQTYMEKQDWKMAESSFRKALKKGMKREQKGVVYMGLGMSSYFQKNKDGAIQYFSKAKSFKTHKTSANRWLGYLLN